MRTRRNREHLHTRANVEQRKTALAHGVLVDDDLPVRAVGMRLRVTQRLQRRGIVNVHRGPLARRNQPRHWNGNYGETVLFLGRTQTAECVRRSRVEEEGQEY